MNTTEEAVAPRRTAPAVVTLRLLFCGGRVLVRSPHLLRPGPTPIGRVLPEGEGIALPEDRRVSRLHATVHMGRGGHHLHIIDEGSKNGTFVNGSRVGESALRDGDVIRIGDSYLLLREEQPGLAEDGSEADLDTICGQSPAVRALRQSVRLVGPSPATVLLLGESGTGKEVAAAALHRHSGRHGPFVAVNCSAIPETLAESQLFGHVAGAFTGASAQPGLFRAAHHGTLFLDEVGDLPRAVQPKLLRALEERAVLPVGAVQPSSCDLRVIAATNRELLPAVQTGDFRADLYARLAEITLHLPPLRDRREDVLLLLLRALGSSRIAREALPRLSPDLVEALLLHPWPGNVREVIKVATELTVRGAGLPVLELDLVAGRLHPPRKPDAAEESSEVPDAPSAPDARDAPDTPIPDREQLVALLRDSRGVVADVARATGRSRRQVYRWIEHHQLDAAAFRSPEGDRRR